MKSRYLLIIAASSILSACISQTQQRQQYLQSRIDLRPEYASAITYGQVMRGMSRDEVIASWGRPDNVRRGSYGETWTYKDYIGRTMGSKYSFVYFGNDGKVTDWSAE